MPGEWTAAYQPDPELPEPFARQTFDRSHVTERSEEARDYVLSRISFANHGWFEPFTDSKPTVLYGIQKVEEAMTENPRFQAEFNRLSDRLA